MALPEPKTLRKWAELTGLGPTLAASVLVGWFLGSWLDGKLGTSPWIMTGGLFLGAIGGFIEVARVLARLGEKPGKVGGRRRGGGAAPIDGGDQDTKKKSNDSGSP